MTNDKNGRKKSLHEKVYRSIKEAIITGQLLPNERLKEEMLAKRFNTSRTPVREALRNLEKEGFVTFIPSIGAKVTDLNQKTIKDLYECRAELEGLAAEKAALFLEKEEYNILEESVILAKQYKQLGDLEKVIKRNTLFHETIIQASHNETLIKLMEPIRMQILRYRTITGYVGGFKPMFFDAHEMILEALKERDAEKSKQLMRNHILEDLQNILTQLKTYHAQN